FTFPDVRPGCVVEYHYTKVEKNTLDLDPWLFQSDIPTKLSYFKVKYPKMLAVNHHFVNSDSVTVIEGSDNYQDTRMYILRNIPAFKMEPLMSSVDDNVQRIE